MPNKTRLVVLIDLMVVSAANMVLSIALARAYTEVEFASFGIGMTVGLVLQAVQRNGFLVSTMLLTENRTRVLRHVLLGEHLLIVALVFLISAAAVALYTALLPLDSFLRLIAISTIPSLLFFLTVDFDRAFCLKRGMAVATAAWGIGYLAVVFALSAAALFGHVPYLWFVAGLTLFSLVKLGWVVADAGPPDFARGWRFLRRDMATYLRPSLIGIAAYAGYTHVPLFVLGYTSPPIHAAAFVAMRNLVQPLQIVVRSLDLVDKHVFAQSQLEGGEAGQRKVTRRLALMYFAIGGVFALLLSAIAGPLIEVLYGPKYVGFEYTLYGWAAVFVILAVTYPLESVVFARGRVEQYFATRLIAGAAGTAAAYPLCVRYDDVGAIGAVLIGSVIAIVSLVWFVRKDVFSSAGSRLPSKAV